MLEAISTFVSDNIGKFLAGVGVIAIGAVAIDQAGKAVIAMKEGDSQEALGHTALALASPVGAPMGLVGLAVHRIDDVYRTFAGLENSTKRAAKAFTTEVDAKAEQLVEARLEAAIERHMKKQAAASNGGSQILVP